MIGSGSWGTTVATLATQNADVILWARRPGLAEHINRQHANEDYLPGHLLPPGLAATSNLADALATADLVVIAVPSHGYRSVLDRAKHLITCSTPVISLTKGIEVDTGLRMSQVTAQVLDGHDPGAVGVMSGPNLAVEIMEGQPAATVIATGDPRIAESIQPVFTTPQFRVYTNPDVTGVELAGAVKNVIAIAAGACTGLGFGMNTMSTLVTRGLAEMTRLGLALGAEPITFGGLAGVGDLMATCGSPRSRNNRVGYRLGRGQSIQTIVSEMNMVAEGVKTTRAVLNLAAQHRVEMPIAEAVGGMVYEGQTVHEAMSSLMGREPTSEAHGIIP